jgi:hypothetical protein
MALEQPFNLVKKYPGHSRAVHHAKEGVCSLGYAVNPKGVQRLF